MFVSIYAMYKKHSFNIIAIKFQSKQMENIYPV